MQIAKFEFCQYQIRAILPDLILTFLAVPTVPNNVMILSGVGNLTVTWMPPDLLNAPAVNYTVMYSSPTDFIVTSDTMVVIGSLAAFTEYSVMIQACSVAGCGPFTTPEIERTQEQGKYLQYMYDICGIRGVA